MGCGVRMRLVMFCCWKHVKVTTMHPVANAYIGILCQARNNGSGGGPQVSYHKNPQHRLGTRFAPLNQEQQLCRAEGD